MGATASDRARELKCWLIERPAFLYFLLLVPFIEPQMFKLQGFEGANLFYSAIRAIASVGILLISLKKKQTMATYCMMGAQAWILLSTIINSGSITRYMGPAVISIAMFMLGSLVLEKGGSCLRTFLDYLRRFLELFLILNLVTWFLSIAFNSAIPYFLGIENRWVYFYLPLVWVSFSTDMMAKKQVSKRSWITLLVCLAHLVVMWSVGAFLSLFLWIPLWFAVRAFANKTSHVPSAIILMGIFLGINVLLTSGLFNAALRPLLVDILHKDITLSGRTHLWRVVFEVVAKSPLLGRGVQNAATDVSFFLNQTGVFACAVNHPHNYLLNIAFHGGIPAVVMFAMSHVAAFAGLRERDENNLYAPLYCMLFCYLFASLVDTLDFSLMYLFLAVAAASKGGHLGVRPKGAHFAKDVQISD